MKVYTKILVNGKEFITKVDDLAPGLDADAVAEQLYQHFSKVNVFKTTLKDDTPFVMGKEAMSRAVFTFHNVEE